MKAARKDAVFFAYLVAIPRHCLKCKKAFSPNVWRYKIPCHSPTAFVIPFGRNDR